MTFIRTICVLCVAGLAGCGSGSSGADAVSYSDLDTRYFEIADQFSREVANITDPMTLRDTGSVGYVGVIGFQAQQPGEERLELLGNLRLTANFQDDEITGSATNFADENEAIYSGTMTISNGGINRAADVTTNYTFGADVDATLTTADRTISTDNMIILGDFYGGAEQFISGRLDGQIITTDGPPIMIDSGNSYFVGEAR